MENSCVVCEKIEAKNKKCGWCRKVFYCSPECQKLDWAKHKAFCNKLRCILYFSENKDKLKIEDFEIIKKLGDGNFTEVYKVIYKEFPSEYFALKICKM